MKEQNLLLRSFQDFLTPAVLKLAFLPFVITMVVMYGLFFVAADIGLDQLQQSTLHIQQTQTTSEGGVTHTDELSAMLEGSAILSFLLKYSLTSWLLSFLIYTVGSFFVLLLSIVIALAVIGFLTPPILKVIQQRHYRDIEMVGYGHMGSIAWHFLKSLGVMVTLFLLLLPFYFVPVLNIVALNLPFYYFFHKLMVFDVASTLCSKEEFHRIMFFKGNAVRLKTFLLYLVSLIPFAVLFMSAFFVIYLGHAFFTEARAIRASPDKEPSGIEDSEI